MSGVPMPGFAATPAAGQHSVLAALDRWLGMLTEIPAAGLVAHTMPCTPSPDDSRSPRMAGPELLAGK